MSVNKLLKAIGDIDDKYIEEYDSYKPKSMVIKIIPCAVIAACAVVTLIISLNIHGRNPVIPEDNPENFISFVTEKPTGTPIKDKEETVLGNNNIETNEPVTAEPENPPVSEEIVRGGANRVLEAVDDIKKSKEKNNIQDDMNVTVFDDNNLTGENNLNAFEEQTPPSGDLKSEMPERTSAAEDKPDNIIIPSKAPNQSTNLPDVTATPKPVVTATPVSTPLTYIEWYTVYVNDTPYQTTVPPAESDNPSDETPDMPDSTKTPSIAAGDEEDIVEVTEQEVENKKFTLRDASQDLKNIFVEETPYSYIEGTPVYCVKGLEKCYLRFLHRGKLITIWASSDKEELLIKTAKILLEDKLFYEVTPDMRHYIVVWR